MFAGFLNRGRSKAENSTGDAVPQVFSSNAAAALAASVAAASEADTAVDAPQQRGRVLHGQDVDIDLDALRPGEAVPELQVSDNSCSCFCWVVRVVHYETICFATLANTVNSDDSE